MLFWPQQWQGALPMATFVAHAMMAWRFAAGRFGVVWWWGGPVALLALLTMPLAEAVLWTLSFASMLLALSRVLPAADYRLASLSSLFRLQLRCVLPAAFLVATLAGVMPAASWPLLLQHFTLACLPQAGPYCCSTLPWHG
ncbi:hypothetical protein [Vogesella sp. XCS3]|uniref:hypothetical protein n=1 Tax=Vogesella sp. XCS3 TaxID=2877939 RepID=UPI001D0B2287|nr:hypothetical protein [Vogesella sp. XCS3]UDM17142.1 hypothetical protein LCH97_00225 [Vogesella sp. XCS3]